MLAALWGGELYWYAQQPLLPSINLPPDVRRGSGELATTPLPRLPPLAEYQAIISRPLFHVNRQPEAQATPAPVQPPTDLQTLITLRGIFLHDKQRIALLEWTATKQTRRVREGEIIEGWRLDSLSQDSAEFSRDAVKVTFTLRVGKAAATSAPVNQPQAGAALLPHQQPKPRRNDPEARQQQ